jgi:phage baseplate assembly protein W
LSTSIAVPFTFTGGAIQATDDPHTIARQEILDVIMTNTYERVMMPHYGASTQRLLFQTLDSLVVADYKEETLDMLNRSLSNSRAMSLTVTDRAPDGSWSGPGGVESSLFVNVQYQLNSDPNTPASVSIGVVNPLSIGSLTLV